jgi:transcriptional regulator with XRE-family HTH domain
MGYERFKEICDRSGIKVSDVVKNTGIAYATMTSWKQGKYTPKMDKLQKIADYLGVTLGELTAEWEAATPAEIEMYERTAQDPPSLPETAPSLSPTALEIARAFDQAAEYQQLAVCQLLGVDYKKGIESSRDVG